MALHGRCLCEGVKFEINEAPTAMGTCHCTRCQRQTGTAGVTAVVIPPGSLKVTEGEELVKEFSQEGFTSRHFCSQCGSAIYGTGENFMYVSAGTLADDPGIRPQFHMMVASKASWDEIHDQLPQFPEFPPMG